jgi:ABC-2 type transport system permease protein
LSSSNGGLETAHARSSPPRGPLGVRRGPLLAGHFAEVWRYRELLGNLVRWGLKVKYEGSILGFLWTLLNPLFMVAILSAVFTQIVKIPMPDYWAFLLAGYFAWNTIAQGLGSATTILANHGSLRRSVRFPSEILVFSAVATRVIEFAAELVLVIVALALLRHHALPPSFLLVPVLLVPLTLITVGLALAIATVSTFYRDAQHVLPIVILAFFYLTPVFYPLSYVPEGFRAWFAVNPFAPVLSLFQQVLYEGRMPEPALLAWASGLGLVLFFIGYAIFNRYKAIAAEIV